MDHPPHRDRRKSRHHREQDIRPEMVLRSPFSTTRPRGASSQENYGGGTKRKFESSSESEAHNTNKYPHLPRHLHEPRKRNVDAPVTSHRPLMFLRILTDKRGPRRTFRRPGFCENTSHDQLPTTQGRPLSPRRHSSDIATYGFQTMPSRSARVVVVREEPSTFGPNLPRPRERHRRGPSTYIVLHN